MLNFNEGDIGKRVDELHAEFERLSKPHRVGGIAADYVAGGSQRIKQLSAVLTYMERNGQNFFERPDAAETAYSKRIREQLEVEDAEQFDLETEEPPSDLQATLHKRKEVLGRLDTTLVKLAELVAEEASCREQALQLMQGFPTDLRDHFNGQEVIGAILAKLGECGVLPDRRFDQSQRVPDMVTLASCHSQISQHAKEVTKSCQTKTKAAA